jgi:hypothetical protein
MLADVTHFTTCEGGQWHPWPFRPCVKPSNPELLMHGFDVANNVATWNGRAGDGVRIRFHSLKLSDGAEWDVINGFRNKSDWVSH